MIFLSACNLDTQAMYCSLSGEIPASPVVCKKSGHLYERRLIEKALQSNGGKCPHTYVAMTSNDLVPVCKSDPSIKTAVPPSSTDVSSLLTHIQNEWDAKNIEFHELRQALQRTRQELATALYRLDASHRVIAKLREAKTGNSVTSPDQAEKINLTLEQTNNSAQQKADRSKGAPLPENDSEQVPEFGNKWSDELLSKVQTLGLQLVTARKSRSLSDQWTRSDEVASFSVTSEGTLDTKKSTVVSIVHGADKYAYVGLANGSLKKLDTLSLEKIDDGCEAHSVDEGGVSSLWWDESLGNRVISAGGDGFVRIWDSQGWNKIDQFDEGEPIVGLDRHAERSVCLIGRRGGWTWRELENGKLIARGGGDGTQFASSAIHPDGLMFATGCADGIIQMWDVGNMQCVHKLGEKGGAVVDMAMSEKGYYLACCRNDVVEMWDLRKKAVVGIVELGAASAKAVALDGMGEFGCVVGHDVVGLFAGKKKAKTLARIPVTPSDEDFVETSPRLGVAWGHHASTVFVGSATGKVYKLSASKP